MKIKRQEKMFPIKVGGKFYQEKDCDDTFLDYYHCKESLSFDGSVYLADGLWIYPDGKTTDDR